MRDAPHILQVMAARGHGGAELYSTDVMLGLHRAGVRQTVVLHPDCPRLKELEDAGLTIDTDTLKPPFPLWRKWRMTQLIDPGWTTGDGRDIGAGLGGGRSAVHCIVCGACRHRL